MTARPKRKAFRPRVQHFRIPVEDSDVIDEIAARLGTAKRLRDYTAMGDDGDATKRTADHAAALQAEFDACFDILDLVGLTTPELNALNNKFDGDDDEDAFMCALLVECLQGKQDRTAEEWLAEVNTWPSADKADLFATINRAQTSPFSAGIPNV